MSLTAALAALDGKSELTAEDALAVRRAIFGGDQSVSREEAQTLLALNADAGAHAPEWRMLFAEAMADYLVRQATPPGYVDPGEADWLIAVLSKHARVREDEVEMLIHILEEADQTPPRLSAYVLGMIKAMVLWRLEHRGVLAAADVERLRRVVFAAGGDGGIAVTRREAEALFDINDALGSAEVDPAWRDLFVRAVANAVLFQSTWTPDAAAEVKREASLEDDSIHPIRRLEGLSDLKSDGQGFAQGLREMFTWDFNDHQLDKAEAADEALEAGAERLTADEAQWLAGRIGRNGRVDANEQALVAFVRANARSIDPSLERLLSGLAADAVPSEPTARPVFGQRKPAA